MRSVRGRPGVLGALAALALAGLLPAPLLGQAQPPAEDPIISDKEFEAAVPAIPAQEDPELGRKLKPLGDGFIKLVKMMIAPSSGNQPPSGILVMFEVK